MANLKSNEWKEVYFNNQVVKEIFFNGRLVWAKLKQLTISVRGKTGSYGVSQDGVTLYVAEGSTKIGKGALNIQIISQHGGDFTYDTHTGIVNWSINGTMANSPVGFKISYGVMVPLTDYIKYNYSKTNSNFNYTITNDFCDKVIADIVFYNITDDYVEDYFTHEINASTKISNDYLLLAAGEYRIDLEVKYENNILYKKSIVETFN